jgi:methylated-DNA-[protein]-cysteine S-methyltransferase
VNLFSYFDSPLGPLLLTSDGTHLTGLFMGASGKTQLTADWLEDATAEPLAATRRQLSEYFAGSRRTFDLPLRLEGTAFQQRVWRELTEIPYGETWSYGQLAARIGKPSASRAVGLIGADGSLTGYGGGLERKQWLLAHEGLH